MSDEHNDTDAWNVFGESVRGATHTSKQMPNQDAILWKPDNGVGLPLILAIADGHGSEKYFRSELGAHFAVTIAMEELKSFAQAFTGSIANFSLVLHLAEQLPHTIVHKWREKVKAHLTEMPFFTRDEWQRFGEGTALPNILHEPTLIYGSTLLAVLVTGSFILYLQLGDGDIVQVSETAQVSRPVQGDARLLANETTSLCSETAIEDFRIHYQPLDGQPPALILLSTDGYSNSFSNEKGFLRVGADILTLLHEKGLDIVKQSLNGWLTQATERGSGDDITLGAIYHETAQISLPKKPIITPADQEKVLSTPTIQEQKPEPASPRPLATIEEAVTTAPMAPLVVSQQPGEGKYTTINAALQDAPDQTCIEIHPGVYRERLVIDKDIELVGMGDDGSVIIESVTPCLTIQASNARVRNLRILGKTSWLRDRWRPRAVIEITAGQSHLSHCDIAFGKIGVLVCGTTTAPTIQDSHIHNCRGIGIVFSKGALGLLQDSRISANKHIGVEILDGGNPTLRRCAIYQGEGYGICVKGDGAGRIHGCEIVNNRSTGLEIKQRGNPTILNCSISQNQGHGVLFAGKGGGKLVECEIDENMLSGIEIEGSCTPQILHCRLRGGRGNGIFVDGRGKRAGGVMQDCEIEGHAAQGILIQNHGQLLIRACHIHNGQDVGVLVWQKGQTIMEQCEIDGNGSHGVMVSGKGSNLSMREVRIHNHDHQEARAVLFVDGCHGQMERCKIIDHRSISLQVNNQASVYLYHCVLQSDSYALLVDQASLATVEGGTRDSTTYANEPVRKDESSRILYIDEERV